MEFSEFYGSSNYFKLHFLNNLLGIRRFFTSSKLLNSMLSISAPNKLKFESCGDSVRFECQPQFMK